MVAGFLGTVIGIERAVALGTAWGYAAPVSSALGVIAILAGRPDLGAAATTLAAAIVVAIFLVLLARERSLFVVVMALGALAWLAGQLAWMSGAPLHRATWWWAGFLTLTIAGERLELARLVRHLPRTRALFVAAVALLLAGLALTLVAGDTGVRVAGAGMVALAAWLGRHDIARRTVRQHGLTRFVAVALLTGYVWLAVSGVLAFVHGDVAAGLAYDAALHALFVGFVFSMIFGHAPIIFPAVLGPPMTYRSVFYVHLALLHVSLIVRIAGDLAGSLLVRQWGALGNAVAIVLFVAVTVHAIAGRPGARLAGALR
jgi:hypothetical protein